MAASIQHMIFPLRITYCRLCSLVRSTNRRYSTCDTQPQRELQSSLFISNASKYVPYLELDLDIEQRLSNPEKLTRNLQARGYSHPHDRVQKMVSDYRLYRESKAEIERIKAEKDEVSVVAGGLASKQRKLRKAKLPADENMDQKLAALRTKGKELRKQLYDLMKSHSEIEEKTMLGFLSLPNDLHLDTHPSDAQVLEVFGSVGSITDEAKQNCDTRLKSCVKFSGIGSKAYYLTGMAAELEFSLTEQMSSYLRQRNYTQLNCPEIFRSIVMEGTGAALEDPNTAFWIKLSDTDKKSENRLTNMQYVQGVSPLSFIAYLTKMQISEKDLPAKFFTVGRSYRPGDDQGLPGLYGVTQTIKGEVAVVCSDCKECDDAFNNIKITIVQYLTNFNIPTRVVSVPATKLVAMEMKREDIEMWSLSLQSYVKVGSVSVCGDYASRRLMIRQSPNELIRSRPVFMVHGQAVNLTTLMALMFEYNKVQSDSN